MQNRRLIELKNIGKKISARLNEAGIFSEEDLKFYGAAKAHKMIKSLYPDETLPVCYYLYSFEGAIKNIHWNEIGESRKRDLQNEIS